MNKVFTIIILFVLVLVAVYAISFVKMLALSSGYYGQATKNLEAKDYSAALKGIKREKEDESGYTYEGGFEQVVNIWKSDFAIPKPGFYYKSVQAVSNLINNLDVETGKNIFEKYREKDREYLSFILLRIADVYHQKKDISKEKITLLSILDNFPLEKDTVSIVSNRLNRLR